MHRRKQLGISSPPRKGGRPGEVLDCMCVDPIEEAQDAGRVAEGAVDRVSLLAGGGEAEEKPKRQVYLLPSVFEGRPPVVFFSYTAACGAKQRALERAVATPEDAPRLYYSRTDKVHEYNAVINILRQGGLHRVCAESQRWSLLWSNHPPPEVLRGMEAVQRTNHFPGSTNLGRKDLLWVHICKMQRRFGPAYEITPRCFVLPNEMEAWDVARSQRPDGLWIYKPCSQSCGRGIRVLKASTPACEVKELARKPGVLQKYVSNPLLIDGYKFDLRVYIVVVSYDPLKVYINEEGLVRLATEKYSSSPDSLENRTMHLTNYSVNKLSPAFVQNRDGSKGSASPDPKGEEEENAFSFKWSFAELRAHFTSRGLDYDKMFDQIKDVVIKSLIAVEPPVSAECSRSFSLEEGYPAVGPGGASGRSCFEIYGFDVMIDDALKPWLLEVNICPSLSSGSPLDKRIKTKLVADSLTLVGIRPPAWYWSKNESGSKRPMVVGHSQANDDSSEEMQVETSASRAAVQDELENRIARLLACESTAEAVASFEAPEWDLVMEAHDEDMRSGGLERIFPSAQAGRYTQYFETESYSSLVLRLWHEAGGPELFAPGKCRYKALQGRVPAPICFSRT